MTEGIEYDTMGNGKKDAVTSQFLELKKNVTNKVYFKSVVSSIRRFLKLLLVHVILLCDVHIQNIHDAGVTS